MKTKFECQLLEPLQCIVTNSRWWAMAVSNVNCCASYLFFVLYNSLDGGIVLNMVSKKCLVTLQYIELSQNFPLLIFSAKSCSLVHNAQIIMCSFRTVPQCSGCENLIKLLRIAPQSTVVVNQRHDCWECTKMGPRNVNWQQQSKIQNKIEIQASKNTNKN